MPASSRLFVYGTLIDPACQERVTGRTFPGRPARLEGWRRIAPRRGYPYLVEDPDGVVEGVVLDRLDAAAWEALDRYEDEGALYLRRRVRVEVDGGSVTCDVYVGNLKRIPASWR